MQRSIFIKIQLHLSRTIVECENKFLNAAWQLQTTIRRRLLGQRKSSFAFWPSQWRYSAALIPEPRLLLTLKRRGINV